MLGVELTCSSSGKPLISDLALNLESKRIFDLILKRVGLLINKPLEVELIFLSETIDHQIGLDLNLDVLLATDDQVSNNDLIVLALPGQDADFISAGFEVEQPHRRDGVGLHVRVSMVVLCDGGPLLVEAE